MNDDRHLWEMPRLTDRMAAGTPLGWIAGDLLVIDERRLIAEFDLRGLPLTECVEFYEDLVAGVSKCLAQFQTLEASSAPRPSGVSSMARTPTADSLFTFDFRSVEPPRAARLFPDSTATERIGLARVMLPVLAGLELRHEPITGKPIYAGLNVWEPIRGAVVDPGPGTTVDQLVSRPANGHLHLGALIELLLDLREQRADLERRLAGLATVERAFTQATTAGAR